MKTDEMFDISGKVYVITGAYGFLGIRICCFLSDNNAFVYAIGRDISKLEKLKNKNIQTISADVTDEKQVELLWKKINHKKVDCLINLAATQIAVSFDKMTGAQWDLCMDNSVKSAFLMCKEGVNSGLLKNKSSIINFGSIYGVVSPDQSIYGTSGLNSSLAYGAGKAGIIQMTKYLATVLASKEIRVNCISPGGIQNNQSEEFVKKYIEKTPMYRMGKPEELFGAIAFLSCQTASSYITGINLLIDGGFTAW
ncbi:MAG: SDR family oxidoreductase [archaeon]